jgi:3-hydroxymyristoyl/3-hydroxydecanoyl-(acyl carrier protein) dehydratase
MVTGISTDIITRLPQGDQFRFVTGLLEDLDPQKFVVSAYLDVKPEHCFGHFSELCMLPSVLLEEALAQAGCLWVLHNPETADMLPVFRGKREVIQGGPVFPGDRVLLRVNTIWEAQCSPKQKNGIFSGSAYIKDREVMRIRSEFSLLHKRIALRILAYMRDHPDSIRPSVDTIGKVMT